MNIYKQLHHDDGGTLGKRTKRNVEERENSLTSENFEMIGESDNIITFTARG